MATADDNLNSLGMVKQSPRHLKFAAIVTVLAAVALGAQSRLFGTVIAVVMDGYLALLIWVAVCKSSGRKNMRLELPYRGPALWVLLLALTSLVAASAATYPEVADASPRLHALYTSFITIASFSYDLSSATTPATPKGTQVLQLASGILLLLAGFPILLSRISEWDSSSNVTSVHFNGVLIQLPKGSQETVVVTGNKFAWCGQPHKFVATLREGVVECQCEGQELKKLSGGTVIQLKADGTYST